MKIDLTLKITVKGYSALHGVDHHRIKARSKEVNKNSHCEATDRIRQLEGSYTNEYRLVKEKKGYIFREVLQDSGISGHHKTMKGAIIRALYYMTIHVDEPFERDGLPEFQDLLKKHMNRESGCKHQSTFMRYATKFCNDCGAWGRKNEPFEV